MKKEYIIQTQAIELLTIYSQFDNFIFFSIPNEAVVKSARINKKQLYPLLMMLKKMGLTPGVSDLCIGYKGKMYFLECKSDQGIQSLNQKIFQSNAESCGFEYYIFKSIKEFADICTDRIGLNIRKLLY